MRRSRLRSALLVAPLFSLLLLTLGGCGGGTEPSGPGDPPPGEPPPPPPPAPGRPDATVPRVGGSLRTHDDSLIEAIGANVYLPGDSVWVDVLAEDDSLAWIGFELSGTLAGLDSLPVPPAFRTGAALRVVILPSEAPVAGTVTVAGFARDRAGHRRQVVLGGNPALLVAPAALLYPQAGGGAEEFAMDLRGEGGRRRMYWLNPAGINGVPSIERDDGNPEIGPDLPAAAQSVDILANPNSLIVTLPERAAYGLVDLNQTDFRYPPVRVIPDTVTEVAGVPWALRTSADGHVLVHRRHPEDPTRDSYVDLNPETGDQRLLPEVVTAGRMARTVNGSHLVVWDTACCAGRAQVYTAAASRWSSPVTVGVRGREFVTIDTAGTRLLAGTTLYALPALTPVARVRPPHVTGGAVVSPDGRSVIVVTRAGYVRAWTDRQAADLTALGPYVPDPLIPLPERDELLIPVRGTHGYFRAGVVLPTRPPAAARVWAPLSTGERPAAGHRMLLRAAPAASR